MLIGVDFDGTLVNGSEAIAGARDAVNVLREQGHKILIFSCNSPKWIERVLLENDIRYDYIWGGDKPVCDLYVDDRNIEFNGDWQEVLGKVEQVKETRRLQTIANIESCSEG